MGKLILIMLKRIVVFLLFVQLSFSQDYGNDVDSMKLCTSIQGNNFINDVSAENTLNRILDVIGASKRFVLQRCNNINNAIATSYKGVRYILYDSDFMNSIDTGNNWSNIFILAHEVGHHINGHSLDLVLYATEVVEPESLSSNRQQELEADEFAGFILSKLGASFEETISVVNLLPENQDDQFSTHPSRSKRLNAVKRGYNKAKGDEKIVTPGSYELKVAEEYYYKGKEKERNGNKAGALILYNRAIQFNPNNDFYFYSRASIKHEFKDFKAAIQDYTEAIKIRPNAEYYILRALSRDNENQKTKSFTDKRGRVIYGTPDVLMDLTKAIEVDPNNSLAYSTRGYYKYRNKNYDGAILDLSIAIELNPKNLTALEYRGLAYRDNGTPFEADMSDWDLTDAIKDFTKLIEIDPNNSEWYFNRAVCYNLSYGSGYKSLTLKDLNMAITLNPNYGRAYAYRASVKRRLGQNYGACEDIRASVRLGWSKYNQISLYCD